MSGARLYPPDYCDAEEMAYLLSMGRSTFLEFVRAGSLPQGVKIGGKRLWSRMRCVQALDELHHSDRNSSSSDILEAARGQAPKAHGRAA